MPFKKNLIFDLGGVIINLKTEADWLKEDLLPNFNPKKLNDLLQYNFFKNFETGKIEPQDFIEHLKNIAHDTTISDEKIIRLWNGILLDIPKHRVDLLTRLSKKYKLILLSNTNHIHLEFIRTYMDKEFGEDILKANFHTSYFSQEIGLRKPGKEIYEFVLQQENIQASDSLFLDDKPENLIEPEKIGIQTFLVDFNQLSDSTLKQVT